MLKSELLKKELIELKASDEAKIKEMVYYIDHSKEDFEKDWHSYYVQYGRPNKIKIELLEFDIMREDNREIQVGDGVTEVLYTDRHAGTVIKRTKTTLIMQYDKTTINPNFKPEFISGGFAGHCTNQDEQSYIYERDNQGGTVKFYWSEKLGKWTTGGDQTIKLIRGRHEFYDYNF